MVTMVDIARICGVSRQTVHAALHGKPGVSEEKRREILDTVKQYNFQPSRLAQTLAKKKTNLVGVTILNIRNPFFTELIQGINSVLRRENYHMMIFETLSKDEKVEAVQTLLSYHAAGLIISPIQMDGRIDQLESLSRRNVPFVTIGPVRGMETHYVEVENLTVGYMAADYLIRKGHRHICYLEGPETIISAPERSLGVIQCLRDNGIQFSESTIVRAGATIAEGREAGHKVLWRKTDRPTGIVCFNDVIAVGVYEAAHELGLKIPEDVSVIGCDDIEIAQLLGPSLTTIALPIFKMGEQAAQMLMTQMRDERINGYLTKRFQPTLVERESVKVVGPK